MTLVTTLVLATRNAHKAEEIRAILGRDFRCLTLDDFPGAPKTEEDANSFAGNATKKAVELTEWLGRISRDEKEKKVFDFSAEKIFVLADDSGLEVDALNGAPGIFSARFAARDSKAKGNSTDDANNEKLLRLLRAVPTGKRTARFRCVLALTPVVLPTGEANSPVCYASEAEWNAEIFEGACEGRIDFAPRGQGGFGYDPLFVPSGLRQSFAELSEREKNKISHRAQALEKLRARLRKER